MSTEILINASFHEARAAVVEERRAAGGVPGAPQPSRPDQQHLQGPCVARAARHAGGIHRHRPRAHRVPACLGHLRPRHADTGIEPPRTENIRTLVAEGNEILVQVVKDPLGTKGARLTTYITLPSRFLVYMPQGGGVGVSARIENEASASGCGRRCRPGRCPGRQRGLHRAHRGRGSRTPRPCSADMVYLRKLWEFIRQKGLRTQPGHLVHADLPLHLRILRDLLRPDVDRVLIDSASAHREMAEFAAAFMPDAMPNASSCTRKRGRCSSCITSRRRSRRRWTARCR
jgi:Rne/Rng family ribonuclease